MSNNRFISSEIKNALYVFGTNLLDNQQSSLTNENTMITNQDTQILNETDMIAKLNQINIPRYDGVGLKSEGVSTNNFTYRGIEVIGRKNLIYTYDTTAVPLLGSYGTVNGIGIYLPPTATQLRFASSNVNDTIAGTGARSLLIQGIDASFNPIFEILNLNGQTPVDTVNSYLRLGAVLVNESGTPNSPLNGVNLGNIFCSIPSNTYTLGVPDNKNQIIGVMSINFGTMDTGVFTAPPGSQLYLSELVVSSGVGNKDENLTVLIKARQGNTGWRNLARFNVSTVQPVINIKQGGFPSAINPLSPDPFDIQITVRRDGVAGATDNINISIFLTGQLVIPNP